MTHKSKNVALHVEFWDLTLIALFAYLAASHTPLWALSILPVVASWFIPTTKREIKVQLWPRGR